MHTFESPFHPGQRVHLGDDDQTVAIVTAVLWKTNDPDIQVAWMNNGVYHSQWVHPLMLRPVAV